MRRVWWTLFAAAACSGSATTSSSQPTPQVPGRVTRDSAASALVPPNLGTLHQEDLSITIQQTAVRITLIPLDEAVIRTLAPDSYRTLHATLENRRQQVMQRASVRGIRDPRVWYITFTGLVPDARFVPTDITVTSGGREFRPVDVVPLSPGFSEQRVQPRETQRGLLIFDEALDVSQPVVVTIGSARNTDWSTDRGDSILSRIEAERAQIRARATARP